MINCQANGIMAKLSQERKANKITGIICKYNINIVTFQELSLNWNTLHSSMKLDSFFRGINYEMKSSTSHNMSRPRVKKHQ